MFKLAANLPRITIILLLSLLPAVCVPAQRIVSAADEPTPGLQIGVITTSEQSITLQATVDGYTIEPVEQNGEQFQRIHIPGVQQTTLPGAPTVPSRGVLLGVPTTVGVTLHVIEADFAILTGYRLAPALPLMPGPSAFDGVLTDLSPASSIQAAASYGVDTFYPGPLVELGTVGNLRDQPVAQLQFYPVQYNPVRGEIRIYQRLVVQLSWEPQVHSANVDARWFNPAYEELLRNTLLNYTMLTRPTGPAKEEAVLQAKIATEAPVNTASPRLKISVNQDGLYKLTPADLTNAGLDPNTLNPQTVKLHNAGTEMAIVISGAEDGRFDGADVIVFYGQALRSVYSTTNIYWLSVGGDPGRRMGQRNGVPTGNAGVAAHFPTTLHVEQDTAYWQNMPGSGEDRWFWDKRLSPDTQDLARTRSYTLHLGNVSRTAATASLRVRLKGYTSLGHRTRLFINDASVDDKVWQGQIQFDQQIAIAQTLLRDGDNVVRVEAVDNGAVVDQWLVNWIELDYWKRYVAENNRLWFAAPAAGVQQMTVSNFAGADIVIFDITDPANPVQMINFVVNKDGRKFKADFGDTVQVNTQYVAWLSSQYSAPLFIQLDEASAWQSSDNGADMIIITHEDFYASTLLLAEHRRAQGLRVATVKVGDLYDEFSDGIFHPDAIRKFLAYAYQTWQAPAPTYVLLIGDANQDYKDNLQNGTRNFVPSFNIDSTLFGEVSSDNRFVAVSGNDQLPDLFIGRLIAQNGQEAQNMVEKIIRYEQNPPAPSWNTDVLLVADDGAATFQEISEQVAATLPYYYNVNRVSVGVTDNPHAQVLSHLNQGSVFVNYAGHGEFFAWGTSSEAGEFILHESDVAGLTNTDHLPIITVANCLNGFFAGPQDKSALAETFLRRPNAGAVAMWAPTSLGYPSGHKTLIQEFYRGIFVADRLHLGAATAQAQLATFAQSSFWGELIDTYVLFGDPATKIGIPPNFPYVRTTTPRQGATEVFLDQAIQVVFNKPMNPDLVTLADNAGNVTFLPTWNADQTVATFSHPNFVHGKSYLVSLAGQDQHGNNLGVGLTANSWSFVVTTDTVGPGATMIAAGTADLSSVLTTHSLTIGFTESVRPASVTYAITPYVYGSLHWQGEGQRADFVHDRFRVGQNYTFTLLTATDRVGNSLAAPLQFSFTVVETLYNYLPIIAR